PARARRGIPIEHDGDVFLQAIEHRIIFPFPIESLNYWLAWSLIGIKRRGDHFVDPGTGTPC
ncbi:MAG: hypothetical protein KA286_03480, partial [Burkholderiales bacterium]|nr:hypothetical protein [Burkholderiales bacterium]